VTVVTCNALVNTPDDPHNPPVNPIVAAPGESLRRELVSLAQSARFQVSTIVHSPSDLAAVLRPDHPAWVMTGGTLTSTRPFLEAARAVKTTAVAMLSDAPEADERRELSYAGLALLRASPAATLLQAAVIATRAGLHVWDPLLDTSVEAHDSSEKSLSPRERSTLDLAAAGLSNKAIARRLGISPNTVKFHLQATFDKLGVTTRAEAVMVAIRRGELAV
jgi:DNA-binding NarL/FixJ family response regulator